MTGRTLILVLGDQLSLANPALASGDPGRDRILMAEVMEEASYVPHHKKKIALIFSAMRHFAARLADDGWTVRYTRLDDPQNSGSLEGEVRRAIAADRPESVAVTEPGEWRLKDIMNRWADRLGCQVTIHEDTRFLCSHDRFRRWADGKKQLRMEYFYREMRRATGLLMDGTEPVGGRWNFDGENRKTPTQGAGFRHPPRFTPDAITGEVLSLVADRFAGHFGELEPFWFAVTQADAETAAAHFIEHALPTFGDFQDAMLTREPFLSHAVVSMYLNLGLLDPLALCQAAERAYRTGHAPLNAVEGFIRQIIGWREYVRGIYWLKMPHYRDSNVLSATRTLPGFYWTGATNMACLAAAIGQTKSEAYAHHIQRLMITGTFALLAGIDPHALHEWYLAVYADAYEWVELPNTIGMSQFADGGVLASKPYAASGNYISKMSDYCRSCRYDVKQKTGRDACPFNPLYWDFLVRHRQMLSGNPRLAQVYRTWDRMEDAHQRAVRDSAAAILEALDGDEEI